MTRRLLRQRAHLPLTRAAPSRGYNARQKAGNSGRGVRPVTTHTSLRTFKSRVLGGLDPTVKNRADCFLSCSVMR